MTNAELKVAFLLNEKNLWAVRGCLQERPRQHEKRLYWLQVLHIG